MAEATVTDLIANVSHRWSISVWLTRPFPEQGYLFEWVAYNEKDLPLQVRQVTYSDSGVVGVEGWAVLKDGTIGVNKRYATVQWDNVPEPIRQALQQAAGNHHCAYVKTPEES